MNLKSRVAAHLRTGSVNTPGQDAINILASRMGCKKNDVKEALRELMAEGNLDLGGGTLQHASYIGFNRADFRPRTQEGRRQQRYAVDQQGRHYRGTATGGPVTTRQATLEEWIRMGNNPGTYTFGTPANEIQVQEATPIMDADVPKQADALGHEQPKPTRQQAPRGKATSNKPNVAKKLEKLEQLRQFIAQQVEQSSNGLLPANEFRLVAADELGISATTVGNYLTELVDESFVEYTRNNVYQGATYVRLVTKLDAEAKVNATLELLRTLMRKRSDRLALKDEIAALLKTTPGVAEVSYMRPFRKLGMYRTEKVEGPHLWKFKLVYVQEGPVTEEQMVAIREMRKGKKKDVAEQIDTDEAAQATNEFELPQQQPEVVFTDDPDDEITTLISGLVDTNDHLAAEVDRLNSVNASLEQQLVEALERRDFYHVLAEAERLRPIAPVKPTLSEDLLARARAAIVTNKDQSSAPG